MGQYHTTVSFDPEATQTGNVETIQHYPLGAGAKLVEQFYCWKHDGLDVLLTSAYTQAIGLLLMGRWRGRKLMVIGDYADGMEVPGWAHPGTPADYYGAKYLADDEIDTDPSDIPLPVIDRTMNIYAGLGEYLGWRMEGDDGLRWVTPKLPDDYVKRVDELLAKPNMLPDDDVVLAAIDHGEYLDPMRLKSPADPLKSIAIGALWPTALAMCAISDGLGGGDYRFSIPGRWAYTRFDWVTRTQAEHIGARDITDWALMNDEVRYQVRIDTPQEGHIA